MAGFETIVRPMILPNIRPAPARSVAPADDPEQGKCVIAGHDTGTITSSYSINTSVQKASATETKRQFDEVRISEKDDKDPGEGGGGGGGKPKPKKSFVDVENVTKLWLTGSDGKKFTRKYTPIASDDENIQILRRGVTRGADGGEGE
jgi:hypothetical protein